MDLSRILFVVKGIGFRNIVRTIINSFYRDMINWKFPDKSRHNEKLIPGEMLKVNPIATGFNIQFRNASLEAVFLSNNLIRITWQPGKVPYPYTITDTAWMADLARIEQNDDCYIIHYGENTVYIDLYGSISFQNKQNYFRRDHSPYRYGDKWTLHTQLTPEEHIYGLGERAGTINLRPGDYSSWNIDVGGSYTSGKDPLYIGSPVYLSISTNGCYLTYFENSYKSKFSIHDEFITTFAGGALRYYVIFGTLEEIYDEFSKLVGRACLPPKWALGYHQSRWGYLDENEILQVVEGFKHRDLPISAIHLDIDYMDEYRVFTINPKRFPNLKRLSSKLDEVGVKIVGIINPAIKKESNYHIYSESKQRDLLCKLPNGKEIVGVSWPGWVVFPDFSNPKTRTWWSNQYKNLIDNGITGFWHDMNEPTSFTAWGGMTLPGITRHDNDGSRGDHKEIHNIYGLLMNKAAFEGMRGYYTKRPWLFSRSGWTGLQRYAWNWTGDVDSNWKSLHQTIPTILGLSLSGHAFSGSDIGGFSGSPDAELYLRWFQMATFLPLFRTHSSLHTKRREPWVYGEKTTDIIRNFLELRYKLMPYIYTSVWKTCQTGKPLIRPLFWEDDSDMSLWDVDDEFLFGDYLVIAPILLPGATSRKITLPKGKWFSYWDDYIFTGKSTFDMETTLSTIPIFVRNGSILPMEDESGLSLHIYIADQITSTNLLYLDLGDGYGDYRVETFKLIFDSNSGSIICDANGDFPSPYEKIKVIIHGAEIRKVIVDGSQNQISDNSVEIPPFHKITLST